MNLEARKLSIIEKFIHLQNDEIISKIEKILAKVKITTNNNNFQPMSIDEFNQRIDESLEDSENDRVLNSNELKAKIEKWY